MAGAIVVTERLLDIIFFSEKIGSLAAEIVAKILYMVYGGFSCTVVYYTAKKNGAKN